MGCALNIVQERGSYEVRGGALIYWFPAYALEIIITGEVSLGASVVVQHV